MATKLNRISKANVLCQRTWCRLKLNAFIILALPLASLKEKIL